MSTTATDATPFDISGRRAPRLGGFNLTVVGIELKKMLRNRRTVIFTLVLPVVLYLFIGTNNKYGTKPEGSGNVSAYILISMAVYGAVLSSTSGGAMVATERALGWVRQLRLTPLSPVAYVFTKAIVALTLGLGSVLAVNVVGALNGKAQMHTHVWIAAGVIAWMGSIVFGSFGLFMGYLLPGENVMQILGPLMALLAFIGGLFAPIDTHTWEGHLSAFTPMYGLANLARWPLEGGAVHVVWILNLVAWLAIFVAGAAWRMSKDTARV
jgi:ABC-2 type transport system permease protein